MRVLFASILSAGILISHCLPVASGEEPAKGNGLAKDKEHLARIQELVGDWRGVGQPQRGSRRDNWVETADWAWNFDNERTVLVATQTGGKYFRRLELAATGREGQYTLTATSADDGTPIEYEGSLDDAGRLVFSAKSPPDGYPARLTFRFVAGGNRLLVLLERQGPVEDQFVRIAEVGYTRRGSGFGKGSQGRECIVTGGLGTIEVTHGGKTYYVCCTGCRDYFKENPDEVLAEYAAKKAAERDE